MQYVLLASGHICMLLYNYLEKYCIVLFFFTKSPTLVLVLYLPTTVPVFEAVFLKILL